MPIPEAQLEIWSHQGAMTTAKLTHESIRNALSTQNSPVRGKDMDIYLQGSYVNNTNIRSDSDVDVVIQLNSSWYKDISQLPPEDQQLYNSSHIDATYTDREFRSDVLLSLQSYFEAPSVQVGNKSIKILPGSGRIPADVVVCLQFRKYQFFHGSNDQKFVQGIGLHAQDGSLIVHFPRLHQENGERKNAETSGWFKQTVRVFKNIRTYLVDHYVLNPDVAPSYFLECMIYNVPSAEFGESLGETFCSAVNWLRNQDMNGFVCLSEQSMLCGVSPDQWSQDRARQFIKAAIDLWNNWR
jgi:hypothetical protein